MLQFSLWESEEISPSQSQIILKSYQDNELTNQFRTSLIVDTCGLYECFKDIGIGIVIDDEDIFLWRYFLNTPLEATLTKEVQLNILAHHKFGSANSFSLQSDNNIKPFSKPSDLPLEGYYLQDGIESPAIALSGEGTTYNIAVFKNGYKDFQIIQDHFYKFVPSESSGKVSAS